MEKIQKIDCLVIRNGKHPLLDQIERTYTRSFPEVERRSFSLVRELINTNSRFIMHALMKGEEYVGFISVWELDTFNYVEHFAIDESARNGGIGAVALNYFIRELSRPVILEVELPTDEMSKRRIGFYQRLGFVLDNNIYYQPSYEGSPDSLLEMRLMSIGEIDLVNLFEEVRKQIYSEVYGINLGKV